MSSMDLSAALFGKTRRAVLALFYTNPDESFYLRQAIRAIGLGQGTVQRELTRLTEAGLLVRFVKGHQVYYQANRQSPIFSEMKSLIVKTAGVGDILRVALNDFLDRILLAFIYGSLAAETHKATSDVDLMVVGDLSFAEIAAALHPAQEKLSREVNPTVYSIAEFRKKLQTGHHFINTVIREPKIFLIGDEGELKKLGAKRLADRA
ncbi:MAG: nucleotidyltransferase domain-containing protein [Proteobacteria bacterium]|nr:nucleotidyltransferase domain-containing protein [Pseudomonadota bacterium]